MKGAAIIRRAFSDSVPVMMGYTTMGFAAGVLLAVKGGAPAPAAWGALTSWMFVSGTIQFPLVKWMAEGTSLAMVALLTLGISFRYGLYGFSMLEAWKGAGFWRKLFLIQNLTDETYALEYAALRSGRFRERRDYWAYCTWLAALDQSYWVAGVVAGCIAGAALKLPSEGIDFAMVALFLVILTDLVRHGK